MLPYLGMVLAVVLVVEQVDITQELAEQAEQEMLADTAQ